MQQKETISNRYSHGKIYKLIDNTTGLFYYGSSALKRLDQRYCFHKNMSKCENKKLNKLYSHFTYEKFCNVDIKIILIEEVDVSNKRELEKIENDYIQKELNNVLCLNTRSSFLTLEEKNIYNIKYRKKNKDAISEKNKQYFIQNPDKRKQKYLCDCGSETTLCHKRRHEQSKKHLNNISNNRAIFIKTY